MESLINQAVNVMVTDEKCSLCDVFLRSDAVKFSHCTSRRHLTNIEAYREQIKKNLKSFQAVKVPNPLSASSLPQVCPPSLLPFFKCILCNKQFVSKEMLANHWSVDHDRIYPFYCPTCHVTTNSPESMFEHLKTEGHQTKLEGRYTPFCGNLSSELKNLLLVSGCHVCNETFPQPLLDNALQHYKAEHHQSAVTRWFMDRKKYESRVLENTDLQPSTTFCYVCKIKFLKSEKNAHVESFPHNALTKTKVYLVKKGISETFWRKYQGVFSCQLCDAKLKGFSQFESHFRSYNHKYSFQEWFRNTSLSKFQPVFREKTKWFYCHICDKDLDGTSDAAKHYLGFAHERYASMYCEICAKRFISVSQLKQHEGTEHYHQSTELVNTLTTFSVPEENSQSSRSSVASESSVQSSLASENVQHLNNSSHPVDAQNSVEQNNQETDSGLKNLKEQVFNQLQKLVQKLYYSKTVPYEYGLDYLKKINKEIEQISENFTPNSTEEAETENDVLAKNEEDITLTFSEAVEKDSHESVVMVNTGDTLLFTSVANDSSELTINYPKYLDVSMQEGLASSDPANIEINSRKWFPICFNTSVVKEPSELRSSDTGTVLKPSNLVKTTKGAETISDLLGEILERKVELELESQNEPVIRVENDVLDEIEILLRKIEQGSAPMDETLRCLERYNEQLDKTDFIKNGNKTLFKENFQDGKNATFMDIDVEGSNEVCDFGSAMQDNHIEVKTSERNGLSDSEVSVKNESSNKQQIQSSALNYCLLESNGSTCSADMSYDENIELGPNSPEFVDTNVEILDRIDMSLLLSSDTSADYVSAEEETSESSENSNKGLIGTPKNGQCDVKYSYTEQELTRLSYFLKLDPQVQSQINKYNLWNKSSIGCLSDFQNSFYNYYSEADLTLFMNFLGVYLQGPVTGMLEQLQ